MVLPQSLWLPRVIAATVGHAEARGQLCHTWLVYGLTHSAAATIGEISRPVAGSTDGAPGAGSAGRGAFQNQLVTFGMKSSMSRKGDCWDNAVTETLFGSLKVERLHGMHFATRRQAKDEVIDWLQFYNHRRLHSTLGYLSPMAFEKKRLADKERLVA